MATVMVDDKEMFLPDEIVKAGVEACRMALSVDIPDIENADIRIMNSSSIVSPRSSSVSVVKKSTPLG